MAARTRVFVDIVTRSDGKEPGAGLKKFAIGAGIAAVAIAGLIKIGKDLVNIYSVQEQAEARLEQTIKSTGQAAGLTSKELFDMASGLQEVTKFGDEAIIGAESLLLTFKDIGGDIFPRALESILDVSEAMGTDLQTSTIQLGKALNDPIQGLTALRRVGIQFTDAQEDLIKGFVKVNDIASAQEIILGELESQFGGLARAAADTSTGSLTQLDNTFGDIQETLGQVISEGIQPFVKELNREITVVNSSIKAHFLRGKALRGEATVIEELILRELEQAKTEDRLAQAKENVTQAESASIDLKGFSAGLEKQLNEARQKGIEQGKNLITALEDELVLRKLSTETAQNQFDAEQTLLDVKLAEFQAVTDLNEATGDRIDLLDKEDEIILKLHEDITVMFGTTRGSLELANQLLENQGDILENLKDNWQNYASGVMGFLTAIGSLQSANADAELQQLIDSGASQEELDAKKKEIAHNEAIRKKKLGTFSVIIDTASAIAEALPNLILVAFAAATGAIQLAAVNAAPIPALATGGSFTTDGPQLIQVGEQGQEQVTVRPTSGGGRGLGGQDRIWIQVEESGGFWGLIQRGVDNRKFVSNTGAQL